MRRNLLYLQNPIFEGTVRSRTTCTNITGTNIYNIYILAKHKAIKLTKLFITHFKIQKFQIILYVT